VNEWSPTASPAALEQRAGLLAAARAFFAERDVLEVETPVLGAHATTDTFIDSLQEQRTGYWLRTSPEHHMKRLLAAGAPDIYQIGKVFRAGERGARHEPEFTMAEWYRRGFDLDTMIAETCEFIATLANTVGAEPGAVEVHDFSELCRKTTCCDPGSANADDWLTVARQHPGCDPTLLERLRADTGACIDFVTSHVVYPALPDNGLQVVRDYPADQAMLARLHPERPDVAERFEVFYRGIELANGFRELQDATEQRRRFAADNARRRAAGLPDVDIDERLLAALAAGLPDCSGVAVGIDRVLMTAGRYESISDTISFPAGC